VALAEITISRIAVHGRHGAREAERELGQHFFIDLAITADIGDAEHTDRLEDTLHYGQVIKATLAAFNAKPLNLIEAAAGAIADDLIARFAKIVVVRVTVHKPAAPVAALIDDIAVTIERRR